MEMQVDLLYVEGISRVDTLYFTSLAKQKQYFDSKVKFNFSSSYFPIKYTDKIRVLGSEMVLSQPITNNNTYAANYLRINVETDPVSGVSYKHTYYYFIDDMQYINEDLIEFTITMDTIQSYMFVSDATKGMYVTNGIIERRFISRFNNSDINRAYIRENFGDGQFEAIDRHTVNDYSKAFKIYKLSKMMYPDSAVSTSNHGLYRRLDDVFRSNYGYVESNITSVQSGSVGDIVKISSFNGYYAYPAFDLTNSSILPDNYSFVLKWTDNNVSYTQTIARNHGFIQDIMPSNVNVIDAYLCPFNPFGDSNLSFDTIDGIVNANLDVVNIVCNSKGYDGINADIGNYDFTTIFSFNSTPNTATFSDSASYKSRDFIPYLYREGSIGAPTLLTFTKNILLSKPFTYKYVPALFDENYCAIAFGNKGSQVEYPLHKCSTITDLRYHYSFNIDDGSLVFYVYDYKLGYLPVDKYYTKAVSKSIPTCDFFTDPYKDYVANNRNRWASTLTSAGIAIGSMLISSYLTGGASSYTSVASGGVNKIEGEGVSLLDYARNPTYKYVSTPQSNSIYDNAFASILDNMKSPSSQFYHDRNLEYAPVANSNVGSSPSLINSDQVAIFYQWKSLREPNLKQIGWIYHLSGYLVNEPFTNVLMHSLFSNINNRYYFNVLKLSHCELYNKGSFTDNTIVSDIKNRLVNGIRLWNVENTGVVIGDFQYDNVENEYIQ